MNYTLQVHHRITSITTILIFFSIPLIFGQQPIKEIKLLPIGSVVTTTGILTTGPELGLIRYMQDIEAGIALYSQSLTSTLAGDSIEVTGVLSEYRGQLQISPVMSYHVITPGLPLPTPEVIEFFDVTSEKFESMLVLLSCTGISSCEPNFESGWYKIFDSHGSLSRMVIFEDAALAGNPVPATSVTLTGIWTKSDNQYQLIGQSIADGSEGDCKVIQPGNIFYVNDELTLNWESLDDVISWVEYGTDLFEHVEQVSIINHQVNFKPQFLESGSIYKSRIGQKLTNGDTIYSPSIYFSAISDASPIEIFFDRPIDSSYSDGSSPSGVGPSVIESDVIGRIDQVDSTLDIAMYNSSRNTITQAVERAVLRGVNVRYIADDETDNNSLQGPLTFPVLFRSGDGIMHNKFMIADADAPDEAWVWTGSTNFSSNQLSSDPNNAVIIHDQSIALNYQKEFDELWGTSQNHSDGRYGEAKNDNTVHQFRLGTREIESYFSPSDETNCHILDALSTANHTIQIGLLLLTFEDLVDQLISLHMDGVDIRIIMNDEESSSLAISRLRQAGVEVAVHDLSPIFHHKYAIIDEGYPDSDPLVITGSHNWTFSADNINDENTLIIHDPSIANIYRQEFEARWKELVSTGTILINNSLDLHLRPNPASDFITINNPVNGNCTVTIFDVNGSVVGKQKLTSHQTIDFPIDRGLSNGIYLVHWSWASNHAVSKLVIQR